MWKWTEISCTKLLKKMELFKIILEHGLKFVFIIAFETFATPVKY